MNKQTLKALIPRGKYKNIAQRAGVSVPAVSKYLTNKTASSYKIHKAALEVALECTKEIKALETKLKLQEAVA